MNRVPAVRFEGFTDPWEQRKFSDLASLRRGLTYSPADIRPYGQGVRVLRSSNIAEDKFILSREDVFVDEDVVKIDLVQDDEILITSANGSPRLVGKRAKIHNLAGKTVHGGFMLCARAEQPDFVAALMGSQWYQRFLATGVAGGNGSIGNLDKEALENETALIPRTEEQRAIGSLFARLDSLITLHQRKYEKLCVVKKSLLDKMFPKPGELYPEIRFEGFTDTWEQRKLGDICSFAKGKGYSKADVRETGAPLILYGRLYTKYQLHIEEVDTFADVREDSLFSNGNEVIVPASGETAEDIAIASSVRSPGIMLGGDLNVVIPSEELEPDFLALGITHGKAHADLAKRAQGKSVVHIHNEDISDIDFAFPGTEEQTAISTVVLRLDSLITLHQRKLELLKNLKAACLDQMFV